ncbi:hypothetical protein B0I37DRAFT_434406 [Chaetomium sp. MPI-CAGE-AT-0009]|nr:hypothetical protein B0I37DRAFT_434406 [Chaetomium sp. MPI-CAGE-AT-0009]
MTDFVNFFLGRFDIKYLKINYSASQGVPSSFKGVKWGVITPAGLKGRNPSKGGTLTIAQSVIRSIIATDAGRAKKDGPMRAFHKDGYFRLLFATGASVAASLVTCFANLVTGTSPSYQQEWQSGVLGGVVASRQEEGHPLKSAQSGSLWLANEKGKAATMPDCCVREMLAHRFTRSIPNIQYSVSIAKLPKMERIWAGK